MSKRDWFGNATLALVALTVLVLMVAVATGIILSEYAKVHSSNAAYQANAENDRRIASDEIAQACADARGVGFRDCIGSKLEAHYRDQATNEDLQAQQDMAFWAVSLFGLGCAQLLVAMVGTYFVLRSLGQSAEGLRLANKAIVIENRPWVYLNPVSTSELVISSRGAFSHITVEISNIGKSPAQRVHVDAGPIYFGAEDPAADMDRWANTIALQHKEKMWDRTLFSNVRMAVGIRAFMPDQMAQREMTESGIKFINPMFAIGVFYTSDVDDQVHYTASLHSLGALNRHGAPMAIPYVIGIIAADKVRLDNYSGLIKAT